MSAQPAIHYAPNLQEAVVLREIDRRRRAGDLTVETRYRRSADGIYERLHDPESRRAAFVVLHAKFFDELGYGQPLLEALERFGQSFDMVLVTRASHPGDEEADLSHDRRTLGIRVTAERFGASDLARWLDHELGHVADILDPTFGYGQAVASPFAAMRRLYGERFGLLWDCVVDGRTARAGRAPLAPQDERVTAFCRLFPEFDASAASRVVGRLWDGARPAYGDLLTYARNPHALAAWTGVAAQGMGAGRAGPERYPGAPCPLCGFPTFAWATAIPEGLEHRIAGDFPDWTPVRGACERCVESYAVTAEIGGYP
jgi:hypothetical protein